MEIIGQLCARPEITKMPSTYDLEGSQIKEILKSKKAMF